MLFESAFAQNTAAAGSENFLMSYLPLVLVFGVFYLLVMRPQAKRAREHTDMLANLRRGDAVVTTGGLLGKISRIQDDHTVELEIAPNVKVQVAKSAISSLAEKGQPATESQAAKKRKAG